jgi:hypothetical protein
VKKVRVRFNEAAVEEPGHASRKRAAWGMTLQKAMASLPEPGEDCVRYLLDKFEWLSSGYLLVLVLRASPAVALK